MRKTYGEREYSEACRLSSLVFDDKINKDDAILELTEFGINKTSANDFINIYVSLVEGKSFLRGTSVAAMQHFIDFITQKHGLSILGNVINALKCFIDRQNSSMISMNIFLESLEKKYHTFLSK